MFVYVTTIKIHYNLLFVAFFDFTPSSIGNFLNSNIVFKVWKT